MTSYSRRRQSLVSDITAGDENMEKLFYGVYFSVLSLTVLNTFLGNGAWFICLVKVGQLFFRAKKQVGTLYSGTV
jgi:hypothetical protein